MKKNPNIKRVHRGYMYWDFDAAVEDLNKMSAQGWQLAEFDTFTQTYVFDPTVTFRYQVDINTKTADVPRYFETFADAGWQAMSCPHTEWWLFRKVYLPTLPEQEYIIYTDEQSRIEMLKRCRRVAISTGICYIIGLVCMLSILLDSDFQYVRGVFMVGAYLMYLYMPIRAYIGISNMIKGKKKRRFNYPLYIVCSVPLVLALMIFSFYSLITN